MTGPLFSNAELANLQAAVVGLTMTTDITIYHQTLIQPTVPTYDYGDDDVRYIGDTTPGAAVTAVAWIVNKPSVDALDNAGMIQTISPGMMRVPIGTAVFAGDKIKIGSEEFVVIDMNADDTWPLWLKVNFQTAQDGYTP